ncbi:hypothetical protein [Polynucleobacter sp. es-EL-1]|uniref:hypothetical protein n=1 Tax=Polynucleobacter sp. es-EL-1 TaxID=1855652 RepID=UPI002739F712|nr:hypothetical protein [Polynucleobacter sp. es-EL-1]QWE09788.1 hypothetical protein FD974_05355 [Polynucleobacter sp. es-EL-1]
MRSKLFITSLSLIASSTYAQPSVPSVGLPPPTVRAEMPRAATPSMPQPAMQRPAEGAHQPVMPALVIPPPASQQKVGGSQGTNDWYFPTTSTAGSAPASYSGVGPLPANDAKGPASVGATGGNGGAGGAGGNGGTGGRAFMVGTGGSGGNAVPPLSPMSGSNVKAPVGVGVSPPPMPPIEMPRPIINGAEMIKNNDRTRVMSGVPAEKKIEGAEMRKTNDANK